MSIEEFARDEAWFDSSSQTEPRVWFGDLRLKETGRKELGDRIVRGRVDVERPQDGT